MSCLTRCAVWKFIDRCRIQLFKGDFLKFAVHPRGSLAIQKALWPEHIVDAVGDVYAGSLANARKLFAENRPTWLMHQIQGNLAALATDLCGQRVCAPKLEWLPRYLNVVI